MDWGKVAHWLWRSRSAGAVAARVALLPAAALFRAGTVARNAAWDAKLRQSRRLPLPAIGVGNLAVGGTGKTPLTAWLARELARRGVKPGIVLRGYGGDETREHSAAVPESVVVAAADRHSAAARSMAAGAEALVLDDCLQRRDVAVDVMLAVVAAETWSGRRWPLPAGPWREGAGALARADAVVVTFKTAAAGDAAALAAALALRTRGGRGAAVALEASGFRPLAGGAPLPPEAVRGEDVLALCAIGEPELFAAQLERLGAVVRLGAHGDHHAFTAADVSAARTMAGPGGVVVTTAKDAVKLEALWPAGEPRCLVMQLAVRPVSGAGELHGLLDRVAEAAHRTINRGAASPPAPRAQ